LQLNLYGIMNQEIMETVIGAGKYDFFLLLFFYFFNCVDPVHVHSHPLGLYSCIMTSGKNIV